MAVEEFDEDVQAAAWDLLRRNTEFIPLYDEDAKRAYIQRICAIHGVDGREGEVISCMGAILTDSMSPVLEVFRSWMEEITEQVSELAAVLGEAGVSFDEALEGDS